MGVLVRVLIGVALTVGLAPFARAGGELPPPRYELKQEMPITGSHISRRAVWGSEIPINRSYSELTLDEQRVVKSRYESMAPGDEPPYPANGLMPIYEAVREVQRKLAAEGNLTMFIEVDERGEAISVSVIKSPDPKLTQALASVLMLTKYKPAICGGVPCRMGYPFRMTFSVER